MFVVNHLPSRVAGTMCQIKYLFVVALVCSLFVSCEKEEASDGTIEIFAEAMSGGNGKVLLDGATATWVNGDAIRINSTEVAVERRNDRAYISYNAAEDEVTRAVYPASLASGDLTSDNVTINFPAYYHYRTDASGHQLLDLPMAARSSGRNPLQFKHLTGALYITITNIAETTLTLQSVSIYSSKYQLSGNKTIYLDRVEETGNATAGSVDPRTVTLVFDTGYTLTGGNSARFMIPVMPVGSDHQFTIKVKSYATGQSTSYLKSEIQQPGGDHALLRNQLGYAPISITASGSTTSVLELNAGKYLVRTPLDFKKMVDAIQNQWLSNSASYSIVEDIDMSGFPVSTITYNFIGTLNGNGHTIKNLTVNSVITGGNCYCALFKYIGSNAQISNIIFDKLILFAQNVRNTPLYISGISAQSGGSGTPSFNNCVVNIQSLDIGDATGDVYIGGILGEASSKTEMTNCGVTLLDNISVNTKNIWYGGFIGYCGQYYTTINSSTYSGNITLNAETNIYAGGFIGRKNQSFFYSRNSSVSGSITATASGSYKYLGSLIGYYVSPAQADTANITRNLTFSFNGSTITPDAFGVNR